MSDNDTTPATVHPQAPVWFSAAAMQPTPEQLVLVHVPAARASFERVCLGQIFEGEWCDEVFLNFSAPVTHWMPLPAPPPADVSVSQLSPNNSQLPPQEDPK
ncbi:MAG: DUF551 domain-containing protein [Verrucomicrobia bacterium]|nr:DUF551 domain-containing protein [Verrucomicrobiota bacterium]